jgi:citrate lyase beta subunit
MRPLRRSVLSASTVDWQWPPPDLGSVPDAVLLRPADDAPAARAALDELREWEVPCILDVPAADVRRWAGAGASSFACTPDGAEDVRTLGRALADAKSDAGIEVIVASAAAALRLREIAAASDRIVSLITSEELLREALGVDESDEVDALAFPRGQLLLVAAEYDVPAVGRFAPAGHHRATAEELSVERYCLSVGLHGGLCATWNEVARCNEGYAPDEAMVTHARRVLEAMEEAAREGKGAISLDGRMIDIPFVRLSERTLELAERTRARAAALRTRFEASGDA